MFIEEIKSVITIIVDFFIPAAAAIAARIWLRLMKELAKVVSFSSEFLNHVLLPVFGPNTNFDTMFL